MKLSTKSTYGLRAMLHIALNINNGPVSITGIAKSEGISVTYLEQLLNTLKHKDLLKSVRGPKGGYVLAKKISAITVADIVSALEGDIYPVHCIGSGRKTAACKNKSGCVPKIVWLKLARAIHDCLGAITLEHLCKEARKIEK